MRSEWVSGHRHKWRVSMNSGVKGERENTKPTFRDKLHMYGTTKENERKSDWFGRT